MKSIIIAALFMSLLSGADPKAQNVVQAGKLNTENKLFQNYPNPFSEVTLIKFKIENDNFVRIGISDTDGNIIDTLVDGEVDKGEHQIYFKPKSDLKKRNYVCKMEIYSSDGSTILFSEENMMNYDVNEKADLKK